MAYIEWKDDFSVGVKAFDNDHKKLVSYVNELHMGLISGSKISAMTIIMDGLVQYTVEHFKREEDLMIEHSYPDYIDHKNAHQALVEKVSQFQQMLHDGKTSFSLELMKFLKDWLINHILGTDMKYRDFFNNKGVL